MVRFVLVGVIWVVFVGGVASYLYVRDVYRGEIHAQTDLAPQSAEGRYDLELTLTFDAEPDPFALTTSDSAAPSAVSVRLNAKLIAEIREGIKPGVPWLKEDIKGVVAGTNELLVEATPPVAQAEQRHAVRVRVLRDGRAIGDHTLWSEGGARVQGTVRFETIRKQAGTDHDH